MRIEAGDIILSIDDEDAKSNVQEVSNLLKETRELNYNDQRPGETKT